MDIFKCSEAKTQIDNNGTVTIFLPNEVGVVKISGPEVLAICAKVCEMTAERAQVPPDFIERVQKNIEKTA